MHIVKNSNYLDFLLLFFFDYQINLEINIKKKTLFLKIINIYKRCLSPFTIISTRYSLVILTRTHNKIAYNLFLFRSFVIKI